MSEKAESPDQLAIRCIEKMLSEDYCSAELGMRLEEARQGYAKISMLVGKNMVNGHKTCHGGMIFSLADSAFACSCNGHNQVTVASGCSIEFLKPAFLGERLTAIAYERKRGRQTGLSDVEIYNEKEQLIALFRGKSAILDQKTLPDQT